MTLQLGFKINLARCIGCRSCEMACENEYETGSIHRRKVRKLYDQDETVFSYLSMACNHCENPACVAACPNHCFKKRRDGIVVHHSTHCIGCRICVGACPFGALKYNSLFKKVDKCNLCVERLDQGLKPICVSACISDAIEVIDVHEHGERETQKWQSEVAISRFTNPSVRFLPPKQVASHFRQAAKEKRGK